VQLDSLENHSASQPLHAALENPNFPNFTFVNPERVSAHSKPVASASALANATATAASTAAAAGAFKPAAATVHTITAAPAPVSAHVQPQQQAVGFFALPPKTIAQLQNSGLPQQPPAKVNK
jgi:hypothetical protein